MRSEGLRPTIGRVLDAADVFDSLTSTRSYRSAITQSAAFDQLRADVDRLGSDVVEALIAAVTDSGIVYGSPNEGDSAEVERLVQERARRG